MTPGRGHTCRDKVPPWCHPIEPILPTIIGPRGSAILKSFLTNGVIHDLQQLYVNTNGELPIGYR